MVRLGIDLGEHDDEPEALWAAAHLAHVACGGHAGSPESMAEALRRCVRHGVAPGAHPSYPDRAHFGRRKLTMAPAALAAEVAAQCGALAAFGVPLGHVKPHGALYHAADADIALATAVVHGAVAALGSVAVVGPAGGALERAAAAAGLAFWREGFADRGVGADGRLLPRDQPGALILDPAAAAARARALAPRVDVLCVHGDTPGAVDIARAVRAALNAP